MRTFERKEPGWSSFMIVGCAVTCALLAIIHDEAVNNFEAVMKELKRIQEKLGIEETKKDPPA